MNRLDALIRRRAGERRETARERASRIVKEARRRGVEISIVGSLAGGRFGVHSDVDLLVHGNTDPARRAMIERLVADHLRGTDIPYDLIFSSDISPEKSSFPSFVEAIVSLEKALTEDEGEGGEGAGGEASGGP